MSILVKKMFYILLLLYSSAAMALATLATDSTSVTVPTTTGMVLCPQLYVNGNLVTSTSQQVSLTQNTSTCIQQAGDQWTWDYFTSTVDPFPLGITHHTSPSTATCPTNTPFVTQVILDTSNINIGSHPGSYYTMSNTTCCSAGFNVRMTMQWVPVGSCNGA